MATRGDAYRDERGQSGGAAAARPRQRGAGSRRRGGGVRRPHRRPVPPRGPDKRERAVGVVAGFRRRSRAPGDGADVRAGIRVRGARSSRRRVRRAGCLTGGLPGCSTPMWPPTARTSLPSGRTARTSKTCSHDGSSGRRVGYPDRRGGRKCARGRARGGNRASVPYPAVGALEPRRRGKDHRPRHRRGPRGGGSADAGLAGAVAVSATPAAADKALTGTALPASADTEPRGIPATASPDAAHGRGRALRTRHPGIQVNAPADAMRQAAAVRKRRGRGGLPIPAHSPASSTPGLPDTGRGSRRPRFLRRRGGTAARTALARSGPACRPGSTRSPAARSSSRCRAIRPGHQPWPARGTAPRRAAARTACSLPRWPRRRKRAFVDGADGAAGVGGASDASARYGRRRGRDPAAGRGPSPRVASSARCSSSTPR